jgi:dipeptidyl aminopeptidase/acylaminoacyl peptidase
MPDWSPDGSKIAFGSNRDGNYEIYVMDHDGGHKRRLTNTAIDEYTPRWSPDGSLIAYGAGPHMEWEIYVMDSTGANIRRVTYSPPGITGINPDWQPVDSTAVPVYLTGLSYTQDGASVRLVWEVSEAAVPKDFRLMAGQGDWQRSVPVHATGQTNFEAVDDHPSLRAGGSIVYHLFALDDDGRWGLLRTETVNIEVPSAAARLLGVYPNPFNPQTTISFTVNFPQRVRIDIHDATGRKVTTLAEREYPAGDYRIFWDGRDGMGGEVSSGIYFLRFQAGKSKEFRKLVLVR